MARIQSSVGGSGGSGWVRIRDIAVPGGVIDSRVYQDPPQDTVLQSCRVSSLTLDVSVAASYPRVSVLGVTHQLALTGMGGYYEGVITVTLPASGVLTVKAQTPNDTTGAEDSTTVIYAAPPQLLSLVFQGSYPGLQTELKAGDVVTLAGTLDRPADAIEVQDFGACASGVLTFTSGTSFVVLATVADRGVVSQMFSAQARARDATTGAFGAIRDTNLGGAGVELVNVVRLGNLHPMVVWGAPLYPVGQAAIKGIEQASVPFSMADGDSVIFSSPGGQLSVSNPTVPELNKIVTRVSGAYNDSVVNLRAVAVRAANGAVTTLDTIVKIANVPAVLTAITPYARLRSGGNNGTAPQDYEIVLASDQELYGPPQMDVEGSAGTWQDLVFAGGPKVWTRTLRVVDTDLKGTYTWQSPAAVNLAGLPTTVLSAGATYILGGFVARTISFPAFSRSAFVSVMTVDYSKLVSGVFTATNQQGWRTPVLGDVADYADRFTVLAAGIYPTTLWWNDLAQAMANSSGTAALVSLEEQV